LYLVFTTVTVSLCILVVILCKKRKTINNEKTELSNHINEIKAQLIEEQSNNPSLDIVHNYSPEDLCNTDLHCQLLKAKYAICDLMVSNINSNIALCAVPIVLLAGFSITHAPSFTLPEPPKNITPPPLPSYEVLGGSKFMPKDTTLFGSLGISDQNSPVMLHNYFNENYGTYKSHLERLLVNRCVSSASKDQWNLVHLLNQEFASQEFTEKQIVRILMVALNTYKVNAPGLGSLGIAGHSFSDKEIHLARHLAEFCVKKSVKFNPVLDAFTGSSNVWREPDID